MHSGPIKFLQLLCWPMTPSSLDYTTITHTPLIAGNLPIETLVARQWPTNNKIVMYVLACMHVRILECVCVCVEEIMHNFQNAIFNPVHDVQVLLTQLADLCIACRSIYYSPWKTHSKVT